MEQDRLSRLEHQLQELHNTIARQDQKYDQLFQIVQRQQEYMAPQQQQIDRLGQQLQTLIALQTATLQNQQQNQQQYQTPQQQQNQQQNQQQYQQPLQLQNMGSQQFQPIQPLQPQNSPLVQRSLNLSSLTPTSSGSYSVDNTMVSALRDSGGTPTNQHQRSLSGASPPASVDSLASAIYAPSSPVHDPSQANTSFILGATPKSAVENLLFIPSGADQTIPPDEDELSKKEKHLSFSASLAEYLDSPAAERPKVAIERNLSFSDLASRAWEDVGGELDEVVAADVELEEELAKKRVLRKEKKRIEKSLSQTQAKEPKEKKSKIPPTDGIKFFKASKKGKKMLPGHIRLGPLKRWEKKSTGIKRGSMFHDRYVVLTSDYMLIYRDIYNAREDNTKPQGQPIDRYNLRDLQEIRWHGNFKGKKGSCFALHFGGIAPEIVVLKGLLSQMGKWMITIDTLVSRHDPASNSSASICVRREILMRNLYVNPYTTAEFTHIVKGKAAEVWTFTKPENSRLAKFARQGGTPLFFSWDGETLRPTDKSCDFGRASWDGIYLKWWWHKQLFVAYKWYSTIKEFHRIPKIGSATVRYPTFKYCSTKPRSLLSEDRKHKWIIKGLKPPSFFALALQLLDYYIADKANSNTMNLPAELTPNSSVENLLVEL